MSKKNAGRNRFLIFSLLVPVSLLILFVIYPILNLIYMSFTDWDGLAVKQNFVGLKNYITMFKDSPELWGALKNNGIYFISHLLFIPIELMLAAMLTTKFRGKGFFKSVVFMPYIINGVAISYAFAYFMSPINGGFNSILQFLGLESLIHNWLSDVTIVNEVLACVSVWRFSGYHIILFCAALQSVSTDIIEAAIVDGAKSHQIFWYIQLPNIRMVIDFILFTNVAGSLKQFDIPFIMTGGGPGFASSTFTLFTINTAFSFSNFGLASAMAITLIAITSIVYGLQQYVINGFRKDVK